MEPSDRSRRDARRRDSQIRSWIFGGLFLAGVAGYFMFLSSPSPDRLIRAQISESLDLTEGATKAVAAFIKEHQAYPANNVDAGLADPELISGPYVASVTVDNGWIVVRFGQGAHRRIQGKTLTLIPDVVEGKGVAWGCSAEEIEPRALPARCR